MKKPLHWVRYRPHAEPILGKTHMTAKYLIKSDAWHRFDIHTPIFRREKFLNQYLTKGDVGCDYPSAVFVMNGAS